MITFLNGVGTVRLGALLGCGQIMVFNRAESGL